jgi:hypothetical protein
MDMPKEAFGGDDSGGGGGDARKKPSLDRFGLKPDVNIRDLFWKIIASYTATKKPGQDLTALEDERFALMRLALSTLANPKSSHYGPAPKFIALYSVMMLVDGGWKDAFVELLEEAHDSDPEVRKDIVATIRKLAQQEEYKAFIADGLTIMLRGRETSAIALSYIAGMENKGLSELLKKELVIFARGDVGENQMNAIKAITLIKEDEEVKKSLIVLLSHWDSEARLAAAKVLEEMKEDPDVISAAMRRKGSESDPQVKKILERILP